MIMGHNGPQNTNYSIFGYTFFGHNSVIFGQAGWIFLLELRRLLSVDWRWEIMILIVSFEKKSYFCWGKWALPRRWCQRVWGLKTQPKSWPTALGGLLGSTIISKRRFQKFRAWTPLPLIVVICKKVRNVKFLVLRKYLHLHYHVFLPCDTG